jgi:hypothetical protein
MRVVLKPAGIVAGLIVVGYMVFTILSYTKESQTLHSPPQSTPVAAVSATALDRTLINGEFEKPFGPAHTFGNPAASKAKISGELASGWEDNSDWAKATIAYATETQKPHGGETCQRIELKEMGEPGGAQICQQVTIRRGRVYEMSVWVRAAADTGVTLLARPSGENLRIKEARGDFTAGTDWKRVAIELDARDMTAETTDCLAIVGVYQPKTTLWVDDAAFSEIKKN